MEKELSIAQKGTEKGDKKKGTKAEERGGRNQWLHPAHEFFHILHHVNIIRLQIEP